MAKKIGQLALFKLFSFISLIGALPTLSSSVHASAQDPISVRINNGEDWRNNWPFGVSAQAEASADTNSINVVLNDLQIETKDLPKHICGITAKIWGRQNGELRTLSQSSRVDLSIDLLPDSKWSSESPIRLSIPIGVKTFPIYSSLGLEVYSPYHGRCWNAYVNVDNSYTYAGFANFLIQVNRLVIENAAQTEAKEQAAIASAASQSASSEEEEAADKAESERQMLGMALQALAQQANQSREKNKRSAPQPYIPTVANGGIAAGVPQSSRSQPSFQSTQPSISTPSDANTFGNKSYTKEINIPGHIGCISVEPDKNPVSSTHASFTLKNRCAMQLYVAYCLGKSCTQSGGHFRDIGSGREANVTSAPEYGNSMRILQACQKMSGSEYVFYNFDTNQCMTRVQMQ